MMPFYFKDENIVVDLREFHKITRFLPRKWLWFVLLAAFFLAWWFSALSVGDTCESIVAAAVAMFFFYKGAMCVAKGEDWK